MPGHADREYPGASGRNLGTPSQQRSSRTSPTGKNCGRCFHEEKKGVARRQLGNGLRDPPGGKPKRQRWVKRAYPTPLKLPAVSLGFGLVGSVKLNRGPPPLT